MANPSPLSPLSQSSVILLLLLITLATDGDSSITKYQEINAMLAALRNHGYTLFTNAITTSDLQYELLTTAAAADEGKAEATSLFTLFAPKDEMLYALNMATDAAVYVSTLRYHVIPNHRHNFVDLLNLSSPFLDTILPHYAVLIGKVQHVDALSENATVGVMVDGIQVSISDLFIGSRIAVHGLDGILLTGMNMNPVFDGNDNESGIFTHAESPAPVALDGNIPAEETHAPLSQFDWSIKGPAAPPYTFEGNIPVEGTLAHISQFDRDNVPLAPPPTFHGNIQAEETSVPAIHKLDLNNVKIPVTATSKILQDQMGKLRSLGKKKREKRHRKVRHQQRRHVAFGGHHFDDL